MAKQNTVSMVLILRKKVLIKKTEELIGIMNSLQKQLESFISQNPELEMGISNEDILRELASRHVIDHKVKQEKMTK